MGVMAAKEHNFLVRFKTNSLVVNVNSFFKFLNDLTLSVLHHQRYCGKPFFFLLFCAGPEPSRCRSILPMGFFLQKKEKEEEDKVKDKDKDEEEEGSSGSSSSSSSTSSSRSSNGSTNQ